MSSLSMDGNFRFWQLCCCRSYVCCCLPPQWFWSQKWVFWAKKYSKKYSQNRNFHFPPNDTRASGVRFCALSVLQNAPRATLNLHYPHVTSIVTSWCECGWQEWQNLENVTKVSIFVNLTKTHVKSSKTSRIQMCQENIFDTSHKSFWKVERMEWLRMAPGPLRSMEDELRVTTIL